MTQIPDTYMPNYLYQYAKFFFLFSVTAFAGAVAASSDKPVLIVRVCIEIMMGIHWWVLRKLSENR